MQFSLQKIDSWRYKEVASLCKGSVLDVGCGKQLLKQFLPAGTSYVGVDIDEKDAVYGSATDLPFDDDSFDTVTLCEVMEHLESPGMAIREAARVSRNRIIITVPNDHSLVRLARLALGRDVEIDPEHLVTLNPFNLGLMLKKVGFKIESSFAFPLRLQMLPEIKCKSRFGYWHFVTADKLI